MNCPTCNQPTLTANNGTILNPKPGRLGRYLKDGTTLTPRPNPHRWYARLLPTPLHARQHHQTHHNRDRQPGIALLKGTTNMSDETRTVRPFAAWLREQSSGKTHDELSTALHDLIQKVRDTGKKGNLTFTVTVDTLKDDIDVLIVTDEIKLKLPEHDRKASMFYPDANGNLTRTDPRQLIFDDLREVPNPTHADIDTTTGEIKDATS